MQHGVLLKLTRFERRIRPGAYTFRINEWPTRTLRKLSLGMTEAVRVTVPEGFRATQIAERLAAEGVADAAEFLAIVKSRKLEGKLFPSTYHFSPGYGAERVADTMVSEFMPRMTSRLSPVQRVRLGQLGSLMTVQVSWLSRICAVKFVTWRIVG